MVRLKKLALSFLVCASIGGCRTSSSKSASSSSPDINTLPGIVVKPDQPSFDDQSAATKEQILWEQISLTRYKGDNYPQWTGREPLILPVKNGHDFIRLA